MELRSIMNASLTFSTAESKRNASDVNSSGATTGLAVGLSLFFLLIVIVAIVVAYKCHSQIRNLMHSMERQPQKKEDYTETAQPDHYTSMIRQQSLGHAPIYENLTTANRPTKPPRKAPGEPEEDLYLQCDTPDEAIYSNDPKCNLAILSNPHDEDVYIMPDS